MAWTTSAGRARSFARAKASPFGSRPAWCDVRLRVAAIESLVRTDGQRRFAPILGTLVLATLFAADWADAPAIHYLLLVASGYIFTIALSQALAQSAGSSSRAHVEDRPEKAGKSQRARVQDVSLARQNHAHSTAPTERRPNRALAGQTHLTPDAVARLTARMQHDLRTPLNAVIGFSDIMNHEIYGPIGNERYREYAQHIQESGRAMLAATEDALLVTDLMARPKPSTDASCDLLDAIDDALHHLDEDIARDVEVYGVGSATRVYCNPDHLSLTIARIVRVLYRRSQRPLLVQTVNTKTYNRVALTITAQSDLTSRSGRTTAEAPARPPFENAYPGVDDEFDICIVHALCELQEIELELDANAPLKPQARLIMRSAESQPSFFDDPAFELSAN